MSYSKEVGLDVDLEKMSKDFDKLKSAITVAAPFISSLLRRVRIVITIHGIPTACVTEGRVMLVNPTFFNALPYEDKAWVLGHERDID